MGIFVLVVCQNLILEKIGFCEILLDFKTMKYSRKCKFLKPRKQPIRHTPHILGCWIRFCSSFCPISYRFPGKEYQISQFLTNCPFYLPHWAKCRANDQIWRSFLESASPNYLRNMIDVPTLKIVLTFVIYILVSILQTITHFLLRIPLATFYPIPARDIHVSGPNTPQTTKS